MRCSRFNSSAASLRMSEGVNPGWSRRPSAAVARQRTRQERVCRGHPREGTQDDRVLDREGPQQVAHRPSSETLAHYPEQTCAGL